MSVNESVREVLTDAHKDAKSEKNVHDYGRTISIVGDEKYSVFDELDNVKARLVDECAAHEYTKARLAHASRLHSLAVLQLERACESLRTMAEVVDSIEPECCEHCGENDPHSCEDDGIYTGPEYPHIEPIAEDPCFYAAPGSGVAHNTIELLALIDAEEEEYEHDEY